MRKIFIVIIDIIISVSILSWSFIFVGCKNDNYNCDGMASQWQSKCIVEPTEWVPVDTLLIDGYWMNNDSVFWSNNADEFRIQIPAIKNADVKTFLICKNSYYAKDKNHVYYPIGMFDELMEDVVAYTESDAQVVFNADPNTFTYLGEGFAVDNINMYFMGEPIDWKFKFFIPAVRKAYISDMMNNPYVE